MQKIMFNDRYELTDLVLSGQKTQTRVLIKTKDEFLDGEFNWDSAGTMVTFCKNEKEFIDIKSPYFFGEEIAVTQRHKKAGENNTHNTPNTITITDIRFERLQDISDEDCLKEGVKRASLGFYVEGIKVKNWETESHRETASGCLKLFPYPQEAYATLINKMYGKGTWESNPYVWAYDFELVK